MTTTSPSPSSLAGRSVGRVGFGTMQLPGPGVWGPPADRDRAIGVLRTAVDHGVTHLDTADFYGPEVANHLVRDALFPYPDTLLIATKVGVRRDDTRAWLPAAAPAELTHQVHDNLRNLRRDRLDLVYLRVGGDGLLDHDPTPFEESWGTLAELVTKGDIGCLGLSGIVPGHLPRAAAIAPVAAVQNRYNLFDRGSEDVLHACTKAAIPFVPYFPLGTAAQRRASVLTEVAGGLAASPAQVALAWLLNRHPGILLIPGTGDPGHLLENLGAAEVAGRMSEADMARLTALSS
ncbi:oxidoreductase [Nonomuraea sp. FMUSA5-5]|uniref:Oxidoreductase n=1 Tax=Nonomuraea composti TaxID=2720023 RepID=A0ABX1B8F5_9ACTN|nr:oxidoreductase [Nonomuraea sp. FMUSA5-5]NJP92579.1 oxidoreductase [Nonomuraea sp. FMUSA5-5]